MQKNKVTYFNAFVIISQCLSATISNQQQQHLKNKLIFMYLQLFLHIQSNHNINPIFRSSSKIISTNIYLVECRSEL